MASHDVSNPALAPLTEEQVAASTDSGSFSRGKTYFRKGHILSPSVEGNVLSATCIGSDVDYDVSATLARPEQAVAHNPTAWHCSCPRGGFCKHIVALLLTWVHDRDAFQVRRPLASTLQNLDHDTLVSIIEGLVAHSPRMRSVVELLVPGSGAAAPSIPAMSAKQARTQVRRAFAQVIKSHSNREWGEPVTLPNDLGRLVSMTEQMGSIGAWRQALPVAIALLGRTR